MVNEFNNVYTGYNTATPIRVVFNLEGQPLLKQNPTKTTDKFNIKPLARKPVTGHATPRKVTLTTWYK